MTEVVVDPAHEETQTLETDFFSTYFFDNYETKNNGQPHKLRQKVGVAAYLNNLYGGAWPSLADVFNVVTSFCVQLLPLLIFLYAADLRNKCTFTRLTQFSNQVVQNVYFSGNPQ